MASVEIKRLDHFGRGIAFIDNKLIFIANALPGEVVDINIVEEHSKYCIGKVIDYLKISEKRKKPECPYFGICGGCHIQHLSYEDTTQFKKDKLENILNHSHIKVPSIIKVQNDSPYFYRNKLTLQIANGRIGFYEENSHEMVEINACLLAKESINDCIKDIKKLNIQNGKVTIRANYNDEILLIIDTKYKVNLDETFLKNHKIVGIILNKKVIYGLPFFYERLNGYLFKVSYDAFFQINSVITSKMFDLLRENIRNSENVLDLYSGVGTLGIVASKNAKHVYSIEIIKNAVLDNMENKKLNRCENISAFLGNAKQVLEKIDVSFDTIIIDPPRKGLDKNSLEIILNSNAKQIIYISCDPMTLGRDLQKLQKKYDIQKYYLLDMFSYTYHVESFCVLKLR